MAKRRNQPSKVQPTGTSAPTLPTSDPSRVSPLGTRAPLTEKGLETMMTINARNHMLLTSMADHKANIMISTNSIVLSLMVGLLLGKLSTYPFLIVPTLVLVATSLSALIFAILSTRPRITSGVFDREELLKKKVNLLFFGSYHNSAFEDFEWGMKEMIVDRDYLYSSMFATIYGMGKVLGVKYRYLRLSYNTFMYGLVAAVVSFLVAGFLAGTGY
ncbi:MAG: hypothetical protein H6Q31_1637 [Bacteroidetes bacterium]|nr:hypothetical protein [Bacteroidota bacterium]